MISKKSFFVSFLLFLFIFTVEHSINAQTVSGSELTCITNLASNTGGYALDSLATKFCTTSLNKCYSNGSISQIYFTQTTSYGLSSVDFSCFPYVTNINIVGNVLESFFTSYPPFVQYLTITSSSLTSFPNIAKVNQLTLSGPFTSIKASQLKNIKNFGLVKTQIVELIEDSVEEDSILSNFGIMSNRIPNVSYFKNLKAFQFSYGDLFDKTSYSNIQYFTQLDSIQFSSTNPIDFPYELTEIQNLKYNVLQFYTQFNPLTKYIDLSNNQLGKNVYIYIQKPVNFDINGEFPIIKFPKNMNHFEGYSINSNFPNLSVFVDTPYVFFSQATVKSNLTSSHPLTFGNSFGINSANLKGTVDETWCNVLLPTFHNNKLEGKLPDCFFCHLSGTTMVADSFRYNLFSNFNTTNSDCNYNQINVELDRSDKQNVVLYGKNLGYDPNNIYTVPTNLFSTLKFKNGNFTATIYDTSVKSVQVKFKSQPNLSFTVSTSDTAPIIDSITQDNATISIEGSFFNNIPDNVQVSIEGGLVCTVLSSTFSKVICNLDYPIKPYGEKLLTILVKGLSSSKQFNLKYTPIPCPIDDCNGNGICNDHKGICECHQKWISFYDQICTFPNIFISSSSQVDSTKGGDIKLFGWFGEFNNYEFELKIGDSEIEGIYSSETVLYANVQPGKGRVLITARIGEAVKWEGYIYPYYEPSDTIQCFNNCTSPTNGICNTTIGECICNSNFYGLDCSSISPPLPTSIITTNNGLPISLSNEQTVFNMNIVSINEYALNGTLVDSLTPTWQLNSNSNYIAKSKDGKSNTASISFINYKNQKVSFSNNQFFIQNGIVTSFNLLNWEYKNTSNILQVILSSEIKTDKKETINKCNSDKTTISSGSMGKSSTNINFLKVSKNAKSFYARIYDKVLIGENPSQAEIKLISGDNDKVSISINLPHTLTASIYSDFSLFLSSNFNSSTSCVIDSSDEVSSSSIVVYSGYLIISLLLFILVSS